MLVTRPSAFADVFFSSPSARSRSLTAAPETRNDEGDVIGLAAILWGMLTRMEISCIGEFKLWEKKKLHLVSKGSKKKITQFLQQQLHIIYFYQQERRAIFQQAFCPLLFFMSIYFSFSKGRFDICIILLSTSNRSLFILVVQLGFCNIQMFLYSSLFFYFCFYLTTGCCHIYCF